MAVAAAAVNGSTRSGRRTVGIGWVAATYGLLIFFLLWTVIPFLWMFLASIKTNKEIYNPEFTIFPKQVFLGHYTDLVVKGPFVTWFWNSAIVSLTSTLLALVLGSFGAYAITRLNFAGRKVIAVALVGTYLLPASLLFIPLFQIIANLNLTDSIYGLMLVYPTFTLPFSTWLLMSYFRSIPSELEDAALIDGCGRLGVLFRIVVPLAAPAMVVVALFSFTQGWNEFLYAFVFTNSTSSRTLTVGLTLMLGEDVFYWGKMMAGALLTAIPPVVMYTLAQRLVIRGLTVGGVKG